METSSSILSVELRRGTEVLATVRPHANVPPGGRVRIKWSGAEYRGRGRQAVWGGAAPVQGDAMLKARPINFLNPQRPLRHPAPDRIEWASITIGNFTDADLILSDEVTRLSVRPPQATLDRAVAELDPEPKVVECGGLARQLHLSRLLQRLTVVSAGLDETVPFREGHNPLWVCVTMEDEHQAWSSPVHVVRRSGRA